MSRPKGDADERLLAAGRALLEEGGLSALTVRGVARRAKVNLGLFHYHFGSREQFAKRLLQESYEEFFARLASESWGEGPPRARLRAALLVFGRHTAENRRLLMALLQDAMRGEALAIRHARENIPRHLGLLNRLIEECIAAGAIRKVRFQTLVPFLVGGVNLPGMMLAVLEKAGAKRPFGMSLAGLAESWLSDEGIEERIDLLLGALEPKRGR